MITRRRFTRTGVVAIGLWGAVVALSGCAANSSSATSTATTPIHTSTVDTRAQATPPMTTAVAQHQPTNHKLTGPAPTHNGSPQITVTVAAQGSTTLTPGGPAIDFEVTLHNNTSTDLAQVGMVVSLGHCSCIPSTLMPAGTMTVLDPRFSGWRAAPYDTEGFGTDFLLRTAVPSLEINAGQTDVFKFQLMLNPTQSFQVVSGTSSVNVTMTDAANNQQLGPSPTASLPISVAP